MKSNKIQIQIIVIAALLSSLTFSAFLWAAESPAGTDQAGVLEKEMRERVSRRRLEDIQLPEIESKYVEEEGAGLPETEFPITSIEVSGNTIFAQEVVDILKQPYENQTSSLPKLKSLAKDITAYYRTRGYVTTRAIVPPQKLEEGQVKIQIYEGKVGQIKIEGLRYTKESLIRRRFQKQPGDILRYQDLERVLTNLNANPDRTVRVVLLPGEKPETTDILLKVEEQFSFHALYGFNNLGTRSTGPLRQSATISTNNVLGIDDQWTSRIEISERKDFVGWANSALLPLNSRGDLLTFDLNHVNIELGKDLKPFNATGRALVFGPTLISPLFQTQRMSGEWTMGFDYKRIITLLTGVPISKDNLRVFRFGPNIIESDKTGRTIFTNQFQIAFENFLGGLSNNDVNASRREADGDFWQYNMSLGRLQNVWNGIQAIGRLTAQLTPHRLVPAQQFRLGGYDTVRGYPEGDYLGDYGYQGTLEFRIPPYFIPKEIKWPVSDVSIFNSVRLVAFADTGKGFLNDPFINEEKSERLTGIGGGFRISIRRNVQARVDWATPVAGKSSEGSGARLHFSLQIGY